MPGYPPGPEMADLCQHCGETYAPTKLGQKYCCNECGKQADDIKMKMFQAMRKNKNYNAYPGSGINEMQMPKLPDGCALRFSPDSLVAALQIGMGQDPGKQQYFVVAKQIAIQTHESVRVEWRDHWTTVYDHIDSSYGGYRKFWEDRKMGGTASAGLLGSLGGASTATGGSNIKSPLGDVFGQAFGSTTTSIQQQALANIFGQQQQQMAQALQAGGPPVGGGKGPGPEKPKVVAQPANPGNRKIKLED